MPKEERYPMVCDGFAVYRWPEFRALMLRLGVPIDEKRTTKITLTLTEGEVVLIDHQYQAEDRSSGADKPKVVDTTSLQNEHYRTAVPKQREEIGG